MNLKKIYYHVKSVVRLMSHFIKSIIFFCVQLNVCLVVLRSFLAQKYFIKVSNEYIRYVLDVTNVRIYNENEYYKESEIYLNSMKMSKLSPKVPFEAEIKIKKFLDCHLFKYIK